MAKILMFGAGFHDNLGDDLILKLDDEEIISRGNDVSYIVPLTQKLYFDFADRNKVSIPLYMSYSNKFKKLAEVIKFILDRELFRGYDVLVFYGGGYTNQKFGMKNLIDIYLLTQKARSAGVKITFTGQTVGPYSNFLGKTLLKAIYKNADSVYVREKSSFSLLNSLGVNSKLVYDDAYLAYSKVSRNIEKDTIIFNFKVYPGCEQYKEGIFNLYKKIAARVDKKIVVIPFRSEESSDEYRCNYELYQILRSVSNEMEFVVPKRFDDFITVFNKAHTVFGSAYHSIVVGKLFGANVCSTYYDEYYKMKIHGFLSMFEDVKYCFPVTDYIELSDSVIDEILERPLNDESLVMNEKAFAVVKKEWDEVLA